MARALAGRGYDETTVRSAIRSFTANGRGPSGEAAVRSLIRSPVWPRLHRLALVHHVLIGPPGQASRALRIFADGRPVPALAELKFRDASLGVADAKVLVAAPLLAGVRELDLEMTSIGSTGVIALGGSAQAAGLR